MGPQLGFCHSVSVAVATDIEKCFSQATGNICSPVQDPLRTAVINLVAIKPNHAEGKWSENLVIEGIPVQSDLKVVRTGEEGSYHYEWFARITVSGDAQQSARIKVFSDPQKMPHTILYGPVQKVGVQSVEGSRSLWLTPVFQFQAPH